jgi:PLP dependent protein
MDTIQVNLDAVRRRIVLACERSHRKPADVKLVGVTKGLPSSAIKAAFDYGLRDFGESRTQEAELKIQDLIEFRPQITWHMIGHLQSNKARLAAGLFDIIHSIDSVKLAQLLNKQLVKVLPVLLQVNISGETTKNGFEVAEMESVLDQMKRLPNLKVAGLTTIAPVADDPEEVRPIFRELRLLRDEFGLEHLSMGMSDDFEVAIEEGATLVRIGTSIFGRRRTI